MAGLPVAVEGLVDRQLGWDMEDRAVGETEPDGVHHWQVNTGGGAGAGTWTHDGRAGGSGIIIVRVNME